MISDRWQKIVELFDGAIELGAEQREAFLTARSGDDPSLLRAVRSLLEADLERTTPVLRAGLSPPPPAAAPVAAGGDRLGPYRLLGEIGRGGMGVVFRARRDDETFQREVAVKLLHGRLAGAEARRRLGLERRILAQLDHSSIARLYDAGSTEGGSPYFVMELVEGLAIDRYCDRERLGVEARVDLMLAVCDAVEEAHRHLVVHRDLKPSNILITTDGRPKLLDFGIAKLLDPTAMGAEEEATGAFLRMMTPGYASPEQVRGEAVTTASDVYSLGVLLFKLLVGRLPFRFEGTRPEAIDRELRSREAPRASAAVRHAAGDSENQALCALRGDSPASLAARLSGDLDCILAKALRSSPRHRYGTVGQLAQDLRRWRTGHPVSARDGSWAYRSEKFIRRHRLPLSLAAAAAAAVMSFLVGLTWLSLALQRERDDKGAVIEFIVELFEAADPTLHLGEEPSLERLLGQAEARLIRLEDQPNVEATLGEVLGRIFLSLGQADQAQGLLARALELRSELHGDSSVEASLLRSRFGAALLEKGEFTSAVEQGEEAVAALRRTSLPPRQLIAPMNRLVTSLCFIGEYERASQPAAEVLALAEAEARGACNRPGLDAAATVAPLCLELSQSLGNQGAVLRGLGDDEAAAELYGRAAELKGRLLPEHHPRISDLLSNQARLYRRLGQLDRAKTLYDRVLLAQIDVYGEDHPEIARTLNLTASLLFAMERSTEALAAYRRSVEMLHRTYGTGNMRTLWAEAQLAERLLEHGLPQEAISRLQAHLEPWRALDLQDQCWLVAEIEGMLGRALVAAGRPEGAEALILNSFFIIERELGTLTAEKQVRRVEKARDRVVDFHRSQGREDLAEGFLSGSV